jgi:hypothetical protein
MSTTGPMTRSKARMLRLTGNPMDEDYEVDVRGPKARKTTVSRPRTSRSSRKSKRTVTHKKKNSLSRYQRQVRNSRKALLSRLRSTHLLAELPPPPVSMNLYERHSSPHVNRPFVKISPPSKPYRITKADREREDEDYNYYNKLRNELGLSAPVVRRPVVNIE